MSTTEGFSDPQPETTAHEQQVEELAAVIKPAMPNHCCGPDDMDDCPYDAHDARGVAEAIYAAGWRRS